MLRLEGLRKHFPGFDLAVSLEVASGQNLALLGPSGSGKSTLLRIIAGLETPEAGRILLESQDITSLPPEARRIGMVFQDYALFPHLDVYENIAFGLREARWERNRLDVRVKEMLELTHLGPHRRKKPHQLSGGERQRVALGRALASLPKVLLMDEPLGALDSKLRQELLTELRELLKQLQIPAIVVTHDQTEAFVLAQQVAVLRAGKVEQIATPEGLYNRPKNEWMARFLGHPNILSSEQSHSLGLASKPHLLPLQALKLGHGNLARIQERVFMGKEVRLKLEWRGLELFWEGSDPGPLESIPLELDLSRAVPLDNSPS